MAITAEQRNIDDLVEYANGRKPPLLRMAACSLCGRQTTIPVGGTVAAWYLCDDCVGTPEAEAAGYTHHHA